MRSPYYDLEEAAKFSVLDIEDQLYKKPNNAPQLNKYCSRSDNWLPAEKVKELQAVKNKKNMKEQELREARDLREMSDRLDRNARMVNRNKGN